MINGAITCIGCVFQAASLGSVSVMYIGRYGLRQCYGSHWAFFLTLGSDEVVLP